MLTRRDVLKQLKMSGVRSLSVFKLDCRQYENYMAAVYDYRIVKSPGAMPDFYRPPKNPYARGNGNSIRYVNVRLMAKRG
jgi:hypothetical protein